MKIVIIILIIIIICFLINNYNKCNLKENYYFKYDINDIPKLMKKCNIGKARAKAEAKAEARAKAEAKAEARAKAEATT